MKRTMPDGAVPHKTGKDQIKKEESRLKIYRYPISMAKYGQTESFCAKKLENVDAQRKAGKTKQSKKKPSFSLLY